MKGTEDVLQQNMKAEGLSFKQAAVKRGPKAASSSAPTSTVADHLQEIFEAGVCDGFVRHADHLPRDVRAVLPQRRAGTAAPRSVPQGICRSTLRRKLQSLNEPAIGNPSGRNCRHSLNRTGNQMVAISLPRLTCRKLLRNSLELAGGLALGSALARARAAADSQGQDRRLRELGRRLSGRRKRSLLRSLRAATGASVLQDGPMNVAKFRTMIESGAPDWDVADITIDFLYAGIERQALREDRPQARRHQPRRSALRQRLRHRLHRLVVQSRLQHQGLRREGCAADLGRRVRSQALSRQAHLRRQRRSPPSRSPCWPMASTPDKLYPLDVERALRRSSTPSSRRRSSGAAIPSRSSSSSTAR